MFRFQNRQSSAHTKLAVITKPEIELRAQEAVLGFSGANLFYQGVLRSSPHIVDAPSNPCRRIRRVRFPEHRRKFLQLRQPLSSLFLRNYLAFTYTPVVQVPPPLSQPLITMLCVPDPSFR